MATTESDTPRAYEQLLDRQQRLTNLSNAGMHLGWDQQVMMPEGGAPARSEQLSALSATRHELLVADEVGEWLDAVADAELDPDQAANVRELRRAHEREATVPSDLAEQITQVGSENQQIWQEARANNDFARFAPRLEEMRSLQRERAEHVDPDTDPYTVLYEDSNPYIPLDRMAEIFETLRSEIPPLLEEIRASGTALADPWEGEYPEADQRALSEAVLDFLGYDRIHGRLDTAPHPFVTSSAP